MRCWLLGLSLLAAGCQNMDPYTRPGAWQPSGIATRNLAAMLADPRDMVRGHGAAGADQPLATDAVQHLWDGKPKPLPTTSSGQTTVAPTNGAGGT